MEKHAISEKEKMQDDIQNGETEVFGIVYEKDNELLVAKAFRSENMQITRVENPVQLKDFILNQIDKL